jgi:PhnB protein
MFRRYHGRDGTAQAAVDLAPRLNVEWRMATDNDIPHIPEGYQPISPSLAFPDAPQAIAFYTRAFGATEIMRLTMPDGSIGHAEIDVAGGRIMLAAENPRFNASPATLGGTSIVLHIYVPDVDAFVERAVAAGATVVIPVEDQFYGDRSGRLRDPFGYLWIVATHKEDVSAAEMQRRLDAMMRK